MNRLLPFLLLAAASALPGCGTREEFYLDVYLTESLSREDSTITVEFDVWMKEKGMFFASVEPSEDFTVTEASWDEQTVPVTDGRTQALTLDDPFERGRTLEAKVRATDGDGDGHLLTVGAELYNPQLTGWPSYPVASRQPLWISWADPPDPRDHLALLIYTHPWTGPPVLDVDDTTAVEFPTDDLDTDSLRIVFEFDVTHVRDNGRRSIRLRGDYSSTYALEPAP